MSGDGNASISFIFSSEHLDCCCKCGHKLQLCLTLESLIQMPHPTFKSLKSQFLCQLRERRLKYGPACESRHVHSVSPLMVFLPEMSLVNLSSKWDCNFNTVLCRVKSKLSLALVHRSFCSKGQGLAFEDGGSLITSHFF